ncbi:MAG: energy-coupling factor transporter transmembrane protein EcfT [Sulfolobales archaeon]|nr:energy-coupling factor transporter transmembrane protein EcfT [Sulfolobales archaeon]MCX8199695.1 energy-coupling factor transporter transmembrane protein EcfT [Sulfolobales archaeon]MDW8170649.1 energy-coupling factor transporter transmembrane component T [Desulfurococcaceae archaeon]
MAKKSIFENLNYALTYEELKGFYHNIDPRVKLLYAVATIAVLVVNDLQKLLVILAVNVVLTLLYIRILNRLAALLKSLSIIIALIVVFNTVISLLLTGWRLNIYSLFETQAKAILRVFIAAIAVTMFLATTTPWEIVQGLSKIGLKYTYLYTFIIALRFIPIVFNEMKSIYDAQRSRGLELEKGGVLSRVRKLTPIVVPTMVCSMLRARDLVEAMELKGFGYSNRRTSHKPLKLRRIDAGFALTIVIVYASIALVPVI